VGPLGYLCDSGSGVSLRADVHLRLDEGPRQALRDDAKATQQLPDHLRLLSSIYEFPNNERSCLNLLKRVFRVITQQVNKQISLARQLL